jgi:hypothetical protein
MNPRLVVAGGLLLAVAAGCNLFTAADVAGNLVNNATPTCETVPCGATGSMQVCTSTNVEGACSGISYEVGSKTFSCASCTDCNEAATQAGDLCEGTAPSYPTYPTYDAAPPTGPDPIADTGSPSASCSAAVPCGTSGVTYEECVTTGAGGACEAIAMTTSNGETFACAGCDGTQAAQELAAYCEASSSIDDAGDAGGDAS